MRAVVAAAMLAFSAQGFRTSRKVNATRASCGAKGASSGMQIVNGEDADECEWKWQVGLAQAAGRLPFCGGMLIAPDWVLTAAHCMGYDMVVVAGDYKPTVASGNEQVRNVKKVVSHPSYSSLGSSNDYALVQLESPMEMTGCVGTVCLPEEGQDVPAGSKCWITGWGTLKSGGSRPEVLQEAEVETLSNSDCKWKTWYFPWQIKESMLCAQGKTADGLITDACQGDSGGPLVCEAGGAWRVFGATSWGMGCAGASYPGIWARVHHVLDWIDETMA